MKIINSYIFIPKIVKKPKSNNTITLYESFFRILSNVFVIVDETEKKLTIEDINLFLNKQYFSISLNGFIVNAELKKVNSILFLDIMVDNNKNNILSILDEINRELLNNKKINQRYIPIISYDYVSEDLCNKLYPYINKFERRLRDLLFLIFTSNFKEEYFYATSTKEIQNNVKKKIKKNNEEYRLQNYFYSLGFEELKDFLFEETWTEVEEKVINNIINNISDFKDDELKELLKNVRPRSNWERFFQNKKLGNNINDIMNELNNIRIIVAHNKLLNETEYLGFKKIFSKMIKAIDNAICITKSEDFQKINEANKKNIYKAVLGLIQNQFKIITDTVNINISSLVSGKINDNKKGDNYE